MEHKYKIGDKVKFLNKAVQDRDYRNLYRKTVLSIENDVPIQEAIVLGQLSSVHRDTGREYPAYSMVLRSPTTSFTYNVLEDDLEPEKTIIEQFNELTL